MVCHFVVYAVFGLTKKLGTGRVYVGSCSSRLNESAQATADRRAGEHAGDHAKGAAWLRCVDISRAEALRVCTSRVEALLWELVYTGWMAKRYCIWTVRGAAFCRISFSDNARNAFERLLDALPAYGAGDDALPHISALRQLGSDVEEHLAEKCYGCKKKGHHRRDCKSHPPVASQDPVEPARVAKHYYGSAWPGCYYLTGGGKRPDRFSFELSTTDKAKKTHCKLRYVTIAEKDHRWTVLFEGSELSFHDSHDDACHVALAAVVPLLGKPPSKKRKYTRRDGAHGCVGHGVVQGGVDHP